MSISLRKTPRHYMTMLAVIYPFLTLKANFCPYLQIAGLKHCALQQFLLFAKANEHQ